MLVRCNTLTQAIVNFAEPETAQITAVRILRRLLGASEHRNVDTYLGYLRSGSDMEDPFNGKS